MDGDPAFAPGRRGRDCGRDTVRHCARVAAGPQGLLGQIIARCAGSPAAGAAAGRHRLSLAVDLRPARPCRRMACRSSRHRLCISLDWRRAGLRRDVVSAAGPPDPVVDRSGRSAIGAGRGDAWGRAMAGVCEHHAAAGAARRARRNGARLRQGDRRVRRHHHLRLEHSRRDPDDFVRNLLADPDTGRRYRGSATGRGLRRDRDGGADRRRMVRAARDATPARELTMLRVDIEKRLGEFTLQAAFESEGRVTGLFGASGSGKTSLVNMIAGLLVPDRGSIMIDGETVDDVEKRVHVPVHRRRVGYVFQDARLFPHLDVRQNLDYGRRMNHLADDPAQLKRITELLDIGNLLDRRPGKLSGGERQRVALGRALLSKPRLLLLDEPLGALDEDRRAEILPYLVRLRDEARIPMIYVSHDAAEMRQLATQIVLLKRGRVTSTGGVKVLAG